MRSPGTTRRGCLRSALKRNAQLMIQSRIYRTADMHVTFFYRKNRQTSRETAEAGMVVVTRGKGGLGGGYTGVFCTTCLTTPLDIYTRVSIPQINPRESRPHAHADFHGIITPPP